MGDTLVLFSLLEAPHVCRERVSRGQGLRPASGITWFLGAEWKQQKDNMAERCPQGNGHRAQSTHAGPPPHPRIYHCDVPALVSGFYTHL
jgi:hypothetical protein